MSFKGAFSIWFVIFTVFFNNFNLTNKIKVEDCKQLPTDGIYETFSHDKEYEALYRSAYDLGNCHTLKGKQTVFLFFIDDKENSWTKKEVKQFTDEKILPALEFLEQQAEVWNVELSFEVKRFSNSLSKDLDLYYDGTVDSSTNMYNVRQTLLAHVASMFGTHERDFISDLADDYDSVIPLIILNNDGNYYVIRDVGNYSHPKSEFAVIFADELDQPNGSWRYTNEKPASIASHILFMFGADDLEDFPQGRALAEKQCFNDIMFLNTYNIEELEVGEVTAYSVGWIDVIPKICYDENWFK